jgi:uncharacterized membrane protein (UPF0127 family)
MQVKINDNEFNVKVVVSSREKQLGMMKKRFTDEFNGMLFVESLGNHCFWMKNCIINLDIIFIKKNKITRIHHNCPPCYEQECEHYCGEGDLVLELLGGSCDKLNIKVGDSLEMLV